MATTTLNVLSRNISNVLLLLFYHHKISFYATFTFSRFTLLLDSKGFIHTKCHDCNYSLLRSLLIFYISTNTGEYWIY